MDSSVHQHKKNNFWKNPFALIAIAGVGYWIYTYHLEHAMGFLPYAILLLCPLMHIFMHGKHGHGSQSNASDHSTHKQSLDHKKETQ